MLLSALRVHQEYTIIHSSSLDGHVTDGKYKVHPVTWTLMGKQWPALWSRVLGLKALATNTTTTR